MLPPALHLPPPPCPFPSIAVQSGIPAALQPIRTPTPFPRVGPRPGFAPASESHPPGPLSPGGTRAQVAGSYREGGKWVARGAPGYGVKIAVGAGGVVGSGAGPEGAARLAGLGGRKSRSGFP